MNIQVFFISSHQAFPGTSNIKSVLLETSIIFDATAGTALVGES